jgi:hypothetical protein
VARARTARPVLAVLAARVAALSAAGCVSVPSGGPVVSYPVTQGPGAQNQQYVQIVPQPPRPGWSPTDIVQGFLTASASFGNNGNVAAEYLTPPAQKVWKPLWSAIVYKSGPNVKGGPTPAAGAKGSVSVQVDGQEQAYLQGYGHYSVPTASSAADDSSDSQQSFTLVKWNGQWRISSAPNKLLLTSDSFGHDYQLRNLYFLDPTGRYLVPDPVYVPVNASPNNLMNGLVNDLITPPGDWLTSGATKTALPPGTKISAVTLSGVTAVVNLTGAAIGKASIPTMEQVSAQLLLTLRTNAQTASSGQPVQSVEVELNSKPWSPPGSQGNPVQTQATVSPPSGGSAVFYYVDSSGYLTSRNGLKGKPVRGARIGTGFSQIAVSPDGRYLAALRGTTLYTGFDNGPLTKRSGGYASMSWDGNDDLWASAGTQIVLFRGAAGSRQPLSQPVLVDVTRSGVNNITVPFGQLKVAPDGVRVAVVFGGSSDGLAFGAISGEQGATPRITLSQVQLSPQGATTFTGLSWYGPDDVITLADPGPVVTEYAVSGGTATPIAAEPDMETITASSGNLLIAGLPKASMWSLASTTGAWTELSGSGSSPAYPG